ncbi:MAG: cysteine methyltransferase [Ruminococcaceae bacterium]|nr:cysteine methyltransferase [Oscillospiraceae bacterium]
MAAGDGFEQKILALVARIPPGCVASYGQLALLAGGPRWARRAGRALRNAPDDLPCHRVVNAQGRTAPGWAGQRTLLEAEGVCFRPNGCVDMKNHRWRAVVAL